MSDLIGEEAQAGVADLLRDLTVVYGDRFAITGQPGWFRAQNRQTGEVLEAPYLDDCGP